MGEHNFMEMKRKTAGLVSGILNCFLLEKIERTGIKQENMFWYNFSKNRLFAGSPGVSLFRFK